MAQPFFSVVIPTKNRAFIVGDAIQSILNQTFHDFEVVVADNDDTEQTRETVAKFQDPRVKHFRSGGYSMPDNWEFAYAKATGKFIIGLEDKSVMKPRALKRIYEALQKQTCDLVSWPQDLYNDIARPPVVTRGPTDGPIKLHRSRDLLEMFLNVQRGPCEAILPRGLNSCLSRALYEKVLSGPHGRLCPPFAPDYTMAFLQLNATKQLLHIEDPLTVYGSCFHSNGNKHMKKQVSDAELFKDFAMTWEEVFGLTPVSIRVVSCAIFSDFVRMQAKLGGEFATLRLNEVHLLAEMFNDIEMIRNAGTDITVELNQWRSYLKTKPMEFQRKVRKLIRTRALALHRSRPLDGLREWGRLIGLDTAWWAVKNALGHNPPTGPEAIGFPSALAYVAWENTHRLTRG